MRRFLPGAVALLAFVLAPAAGARVTLVATGTPELVYLGIPRNEVVARQALPGSSRAVAVTRDGTRGFVTAGGEVVAVDVNTRQETLRSALGPGPPEVSDIKLSPGGETLYAVRGTQLLVLDAQTLVQRAAIELRGEGGALAVANDGGRAAVVLTSGRVAIVELGTNVLLRHVRAEGRARRGDRRQRRHVRHGARAPARHLARPAQGPQARRSGCPPAPAAA